MNITPKGAPTMLKPGSAKAEPVVSAREKAISALMGQNNAPSQQIQGTKISVEDMGALVPKASQLADTSGQNHTSEAQEAVSTETAPQASEAINKVEEAPLSNQYAVLAKKERALRAKVQAQEAAIKAREAALQAKEQALKTQEEEYRSKYVSKDVFSSDPLTALQELGITYDQLTEAALNRPQADPAMKSAIAKLEQQIQAQAKLIEESKQEQVKQQQAAYDQALNQIKQDAKSLISSDPAFETIKETGAVDEVVNLIKETFDKDGILLSVEEAAQEVEDYLVDEALKLAKLKKIQSRLTAPVSTEAKPQAAEVKQATTLTNSIGSTKKLSARERALLAFKGDLK